MILKVPIREYKPDKFFRASIDLMENIEGFKTYVGEYFFLEISAAR